MSAMLLSKEKWPDFTAALGEKRRLWAPRKEEDALRFVPLEEGEETSLDYRNTRVPPKEFLFPQTETICRFQAGATEVEAVLPDKEATILGIRPCDARADTIVERLFRWDVDDPYYLKRKELVTLVGLACNEPGLNCFCTSMGGGPASKEGLDLLMTDLEDRYLLEPLTTGGETLLTEAASLLEEAREEDLVAARDTAARAEEGIRRTVNSEGVPAGLPGLWDDPLWAKVSAACLGCGTCTYLCPTCHCFDIQDETEGFSGRRCRVWDSCMFEEYTLHTSAHNPRPTRRERTRNRISHKFSYYVDKFDVIACVGCGRCSNLCPVNIDLVDVIRQVKEAL